jgi:uncharacterized protein (TIGR02099 family)
MRAFALMTRRDIGLVVHLSRSYQSPVDQPPVTPPVMSSPRRKILKLTAYVAGGVFVSLALLLIAFRIVLARAPEYRAQVQTWVSERTQLDIEFARMDARWRFYGPELVFDQAVIRSADRTRNYVSARRVSLGYDLWTAISTFRLAAARLTIEAPELQVIRTLEGRFEVVGQSDLPDRDPNQAFEPDAMPTGRLKVVDAHVSFRDLKSDRGPWIVPGVSFELIRAGSAMELEGAAELPESLGKSLRFNAETAGKLAAANDLVWRFAIEARELNLAGWAELGPPNSLAPAVGQGSFQLSGAFQGARIDDFAAQVRFDNVTLTLPIWSLPLPAEGQLLVPVDDQAEADTVAAAVAAVSESKSTSTDAVDQQSVSQSSPTLPLAPPVNSTERIHAPYKTIAFDLKVTHRQQGTGDALQDTWNVRVKDIELSRAGQAWNGAAFDVTAVNTAQGAVQVSAVADVIVLQNLWPLLAYAPESEWLAQLRAMSATGRVQELKLEYARDVTNDALEADAAVNATTRYALDARFQQLGVKAIGKLPGFDRFSGTVHADEASGYVELNVREGDVLMPRFFRTALPADRVTGKLTWQREATGWRIATDDLVIDNADGHVNATADIIVPSDGTSPLVEAKAVASDLVARAAPRYMPAGTLNRGALSWLDRAFPKGRVPSATLELRGPIKSFPFRNNEGLFLIQARIEDLTLDYQPGWIPATQLVIDAEFRNQGMSAKVLSAEVNGLRVTSATGRFMDFKTPELLLEAEVEGDLAQAVPFLQQSPIGPALGKPFMALEAQGALHSILKLRMPLKNVDQKHLTVDSRINAATVGLQGLLQRATQVAGKVMVEDHAVKSISLQGEFLQGPMTVTGGVEGRYTGSGAGVQLQAQGRAAGTQLAELLHLPSSVPMSGSLQWQLRGRIPRHAPDEPARPSVTITSDGRGLTLGLPEPIGKSAEQTRAISFDIETPADSTLMVRAAFGKARALARLQHSDETWQFDRGGLRVDGQAAALPAHSGMRIEGDVERFVLDEWLKIKGDRPGGRPLSEYLRAANVTVGEFGLYGYTWKKVRGILQAADSAWRVDVVSDDITGQLTIPYSFDSGAPLELSLSKLDIGDRSGGGPATHTDPRDLPALRGHVDALELSGRPVGMARFQMEKVPRGVKLASLELRGASFTANARGDWLKSDKPDDAMAYSSLTFDVASTDARETLRAFNYHDVIAAKRANVHASLNWPGGPDQDMLGRASGSFMIEMADGQLLGVQPGATGRVLGLMSLSALPRRLSLDFSDLTDKGLSFDSIHGDFELKNGDAFTDNLLLRGPAAEIGIVGRTGLGAHDYDQTAIVTGELGGSLGVAGTVVGGPVVGAALLLFSQIFKEPLKGATRGYYRITGPWEDPKVEQIDKNKAGQSVDTESAKSVAPAHSESKP